MLKEHKPIYDTDVNDFLIQTTKLINEKNLILENWITQNHVSIYKNWIYQSKRRKIIGLDDFEYCALCSGTSQVIENFINRNQQRRLRFSRSEFVLSRIVCDANSINWDYLEEDEIRENDAVIVSWPFSGNGGDYPNISYLIKDCETYCVPILVDAAYFGIATDIEILVTSHCITDVCISLSKPFSTMLRHGIRFTRRYFDDTIQNSSKQGILHRPTIIMASELMLNYNSDYIVEKYFKKNKKICQENFLVSTPTITLALGDNNIHSEFNRGDFTRVCITDELMK
jgi:hypothetical protein